MCFLSKSDKIMSKKLVFVPRGFWTPILLIFEGPEALWKGFWRLQGGGDPSKAVQVKGEGSPGAGL